MKVLTKEQIEINRQERLSKVAPKKAIRRNIWGIEKSLQSHEYIIPEPNADYLGLTRDDLEEHTVKRAIEAMRAIRKQIESLGALLKNIDPEKIPILCKELGMEGELNAILSSPNISENLKWQIIYNLDKVV